MKRFLTISLLLSLLTCGETQACISEAPTYNYYMMHVCPSTAGMFYERTGKFWKEYSNGKCDSYNNYSPTVREVATEKRDREMLAYMDELDKYLRICDQLKETWSYPTAQELAGRRATLQQMTAKCKAYKGTRLKPQYALLLMRAQMLLGQYNANILYWTNTATKMRPSVYRDMMENIYANALLNTGKRQEACDIYAAQGDWESIKWMTRKYRNMAGIKALYAKNPNSPTLTYLVEDFVNNMQETLDQKNAAESKKDLFGDFDEEWIKTIGRKPIYSDEAKAFVAFANSVIKEGKTHNPCLWQTAIGVITYLNGDAVRALGIMDKAINMNGTEMMKDNARCVRMICAASANKMSQQYNQFLTDEFTWLDNKVNNDKKNGADYLLRMKERLVHRTLIPRYRAEGHFEMAAYMLDMIERQSISRYYQQDNEEESGYNWNREYSSYYFGCLDKLSADSLVLYKRLLFATPANCLERYLKERVYKNEAYYNDIIGTKMMAEGRFEEAVPYLEKVPLDFLRKQNICAYMAMRDYSKPRWLTKQAIKEDSEYNSNYRNSLNRNPKLDFCRDMMRLQPQHDLSRANSEQRINAAYELAVRYFQASCYGDCWYLTHYGKSVSDSTRVGEKDFAQAAIEYLCESKNSTDFNMREQSLYALAYIPTEPYMMEVYDPKTYDIKIVINKSRQFFAMKELDDFAIANSGKTSRYVSKCDVLRKFRKIK